MQLMDRIWSPQRANTLPTGESILQRSYRPRAGYWIVLATCRNSITPYLVCHVGEDGTSYERVVCDRYGIAEALYLKRINKTR